MVPLSEQDAIWAGIEESPDLSEIASAIFKKKIGSGSTSRSSDIKLVKAIVGKNKDAFTAVVGELTKREITVQSTWVQNDALLFFLIVGLKCFDVKMPSIFEVLDVRDRATHGMEKVATRVYRDILQGDYTASGEGGFIKVVFRDLTGEAKLNSSEIRKLYSSLSPDLIHLMSPFYRLLALRAYGIVLTSWEHVVYETVPDLLEGLSSLKNKFRLTDIWTLFWSLPVGAMVSLCLLLGAAFGLGIGFEGSKERFMALFLREVPAKISSVNQDQTALPLSLLELSALFPKQGIEAPVIVCFSFPKEGETASQVKASVPITEIESGMLIVVKSGQGSASVVRGTITGNSIIWWVDSANKGDNVFLVLRAKNGSKDLLGQVKGRISVTVK
jgi:hypothetical protein